MKEKWLFAKNVKQWLNIINLYDNNHSLISTSGTKYVSGVTLLTYEVNGLSDDKTYYIEINGITVNNTQITSGKDSFLVNYYEPYSSQAFEAKMMHVMDG